MNAVEDENQRIVGIVETEKEFQSANNNDVLIEGIESFNKGRDENEVIENNELEIQNSFVEGENIEMVSKQCRKKILNLLIQIMFLYTM